MPAITLAVSAEIKPIDPVVFYDPNKPNLSCLVAGLDETTLAIPIVCSVMGMVLIIVGIRQCCLQNRYAATCKLANIGPERRARCPWSQTISGSSSIAQIV
jgi:hypothetical protein